MKHCDLEWMKILKCDLERTKSSKNGTKKLSDCPPPPPHPHKEVTPSGLWFQCSAKWNTRSWTTSESGEITSEFDQNPLDKTQRLLPLSFWYSAKWKTRWGKTSELYSLRFPRTLSFQPCHPRQANVTFTLIVKIADVGDRQGWTFKAEILSILLITS